MLQRLPIALAKAYDPDRILLNLSNKIDLKKDK